jgi:rhodanese-related sulfurtransferase
MKKVRILTFYFFTAFLSGCLDDTFSPGEYSVSYSADLVAYFETHGDFINSADNPAFISADELFNNISNCLILDVRSNDEFQSGHISGAVNVNLNGLIGELDNQSLQQFEKIVIVSRTGQKSAYAASLLRLYGINNVFSLKYGMTVWNKDFLRYWSSAKGNSKYLSQYKQAHFTKPRLGTELPVIDLENDDLAMDEIVRLRITELLNENSFNNSTAVIDELDLSLIHI